MKKIGKNKIILTLSSLAILAGVSTIALASQSYKKTSNTASASAITVKGHLKMLVLGH